MKSTEAWLVFWMVADLLLIMIYGVVKINRLRQNIELVPLITILLPIQNQAARLEAVIHALARYRQQWAADVFEVVVIDYHSTDESLLILQKLARSYPFLRFCQHCPGTSDFLQEERPYVFIQSTILSRQGLDICRGKIICLVKLERLGASGIIGLIESLFRMQTAQKLLA